MTVWDGISPLPETFPVVEDFEDLPDGPILKYLQYSETGALEPWEQAQVFSTSPASPLGAKRLNVPIFLAPIIVTAGITGPFKMDMTIASSNAYYALASKEGIPYGVRQISFQRAGRYHVMGHIDITDTSVRRRSALLAGSSESELRLELKVSSSSRVEVYEYSLSGDLVFSGEVNLDDIPWEDVGEGEDVDLSGIPLYDNLFGRFLLLAAGDNIDSLGVSSLNSGSTWRRNLGRARWTHPVL